MNILLSAALLFGVRPTQAMRITGPAVASSIRQWGRHFSSALRSPPHRFHNRNAYSVEKRFTRVGMDLFIHKGMRTLFLLIATRAAMRIGPEAGAAHQASRQVLVFPALLLDAPPSLS